MNWAGFYTIVRREIVRFFRIWTQTLLPPMITMSLYFLIFGNLVGGRIGEMGGFQYAEFIAPGLVMLAVITSAYANVSSSFFGSRFGKNIEELLIAPVPHSMIIIGYAIGGTLRGLIVGVGVLAVAEYFTAIYCHHIFLTALIIFMSAFLFALLGFLNGLVARKFDDVMIIPTFILTPLLYMGGIFYSIQLLPEFWQWVSKLNPILYMVNAFRYGLLGVSDINVNHAILMLSGFIIVIFSLNLTLLNRGVGIRT